MNEFIFDVAGSPDEERRYFPLTLWHEKQISCLTRIHLETCSPQEIPKTLKCVMLILRITFFFRYFDGNGRVRSGVRYYDACYYIAMMAHLPPRCFEIQALLKSERISKSW